jgi:hypothetical protein
MRGGSLQRHRRWRPRRKPGLQRDLRTPGRSVRGHRYASLRDPDRDRGHHGPYHLAERRGQRAGRSGQERWVKGYTGEVYGTAVYKTQNYTQTVVTSTSDNNFVLAEGGIGAVAFEDMDAKIVINDVNSPYKNVDSIAWYAMFGTSKIANERIVRLYTNAV